MFWEQSADFLILQLLCNLLPNFLTLNFTERMASGWALNKMQIREAKSFVFIILTALVCLQGRTD